MSNNRELIQAAFDAVRKLAKDAGGAKNPGGLSGDFAAFEFGKKSSVLLESGESAGMKGAKVRLTHFNSGAASQQEPTVYDVSEGAQKLVADIEGFIHKSP